MSIKVNDSKDPVAEQDSLLVQVDYANQPIPNNRLPKGLYYSFKNKWVDMITLLTPAIKKIVTANTTVPAWGSITGTLSNQTDLQSALDNKMSSDLTDSHIFVGDATNKATDVAMTGDVTIDNTGATTLANTAVTAGTYGNSTNVPQIVVDSKGRIIGASNVAISGASVTPSALTKTDDTNVTLILGGTPSTALLQAVTLTLGWTGTLADGRIASASAWNGAVTDVALKANKTETTITIDQYTSNTTLTAVTTEQLLASLEIPANTYETGDNIILKSLITKLGANGYVTVSYRVATVSNPSQASLSGLPLIGRLITANAGVVFIPFERYDIHVDSATSTLSTSAVSVIHTDISNSSSSAITNNNIDWSVQKYIIITAQLQSASDVLTLHNFKALK